MNISLVTSAPSRVYAKKVWGVLRLGPRDYMVSCELRVSDEPWVISYDVSGQGNAFHNRVRARNGKFAISSIANRRAFSDNWMGFKAAHIFPFER